MLIRCPQCGKTLKVPDSAAGKRAKCPGCSTLVPIPAADASAEDAEPRPPSSRSASADSPSQSPAAPGAAERRERRRRAQSEPPAASGRSSEGTRSQRPSRASRPATRRRRSPPGEDAWDDADAFESDQGDFGDESAWVSEGDVADENPYAAPPPGRAAGRGRRGRAAGLETVGLGLLIQGGSIAAILLTFAGLVLFALLFSQAGGNAGGRGIMTVIGGAGGLVILGAAFGILVGEFLCLATPARTGAKGLITAAVACLTLQLILNIVLRVAGRDLGTVLLLTLTILTSVLGIAHFVTYLLFQKTIAAWAGHHELARQAHTILVGMLVCMGAMLFVVLLGQVGGGMIVGLLGLIVVLPAAIASLVFSVMMLFLLFRLGSALRS